MRAALRAPGASLKEAARVAVECTCGKGFLELAFLFFMIQTTNAAEFGFLEKLAACFFIHSPSKLKVTGRVKFF